MKKAKETKIKKQNAKSLKDLLYYLNPKNITQEAASMGYSANMKKLATITLAYIAFTIGMGLIYRLEIPYITFMVVAGLLLVPKLAVNTYRKMFERKRFEDVSSYIEQMLLSFSGNKKVLTSLESVRDMYATQKGPMYDTLTRAIEHIANPKGSSGDVVKEALDMVEEDYPCRKIETMHRYIRKAESQGGDVQKTVEILLDDRANWDENQLIFMSDLRKMKKSAVVCIILSMLFCMLPVILTGVNSLAEVDIANLPAVQVATCILWVIDLLVYLKADNVEATCFIAPRKGKDPAKIYNDYKSITHMQARKASIISFCMFTPIVILMFVMASLMATQTARVIMYAGVLVLAAFDIAASTQHIWGKGIRKQRVAEEVKKAFPEWILEMSLLMQTESVKVAMYKSYPTAPEILKPELEVMYNRLQENPLDRDAYMDFMSEFNISSVRSTMMNLYSQTVGGGASVAQLETSFRENTHLQRKAEAEENKAILMPFNYMGYIPLLAATMHVAIDMMMFFFVAMEVMTMATGL